MENVECEEVEVAECEEMQNTECEEMQNIECEEMQNIECEEIQNTECEGVQNIKCEEIANTECEELENTECDGTFEFESDHLALKGNNDYAALLRYIVKLEIQKIKAVKDIEQLAEQKNKALEDPLTFVTNLQKGDVSFPLRQTIPNAPEIDWPKYGINDVESEDSKPSQGSSLDDVRFFVRGRKVTDDKPETFNQLWSHAEQRRLVELLEIYPEETVDANRYKKIAQALGTRTSIQVMSRVQKYFAKLAKIGLPIPGRAPKKSSKEKVKTNLLYKKSTFFPQLQVPIKMEIEDEAPRPSTSTEVPETHNIDQHKYELLKLAANQRAIDEKFPIIQTGTRCVCCYKTTFMGARWTDHAGTDYCTDCIVEFLPVEKLTPIR